MQLAVREALWFHGLFFVVAAAVLLFADSELGLGLTWLAIGYNVALPALGLVRGHAEWLWLWLFLLPLSIALVVPDWALAAIGGTLVFPDHGGWRVGGLVPAYFAGLWMTLLFPILLLSNAQRRPYRAATLLALVAFCFWEWAAPQMGLWQHQGVDQLAGVALYPLIPEVMLVLTTVWAYRHLRSSPLYARVTGALTVAIFYAGALFIALLVERAGA